MTGASRGFGAEITRAALAAGHQVVATARTPEKVSRLFPDAGDALLAVPLDVNDEGQVAAAVDAAVARFGHVINISSVGGFASAAGWGVYASTKFAVEGFTEALHDELAPLDVHVTIVEPGYFRTDFLDPTSLDTGVHVIDDYAATSGAMRDAVPSLNHTQPGDPVKAARAIVDLGGTPEPPLRLQLGTDTLQAVEAKLDAVRKEMDAWRHIAVTTDHA